MQHLNEYRATYLPSKGILTVVLWYIINRIFFYTCIPYPSVFKCFLLRLFGAKIGKEVIVKPRVYIKYPWNMTVGDNSWIGELVWIDNLGKVSIGRDCCVSQGVYLFNGNHNYYSRTFDLFVKDILIEDHVWIGAKSVVCPGAILRNSAVVSVGSIVNGEVDKLTIVSSPFATFLKMRKIK